MIDCDVLVVGSGAAGLACAVRAAHLGLRVLVAEKEAVFGGTTARSGGWLWIPANRRARDLGIADSIDAARTYLRHELAEAFDGRRIDGFLDNGAAMVDFFERETSVEFILGPAFADYHSDVPGALIGGRSIRAKPFDLRELGTWGARLSPPLAENTFGGMMIDFGAELGHFYNVARSPASALYVARLFAGYARDRLLHGRAMRLTTGNALAARLLKSAVDAAVDLYTEMRVTGLETEGGGVRGAVLDGPSGRRTVRPRLATVLACGGFGRDTARRVALYPHARDGSRHWSLTAPGSTGDGLSLGQSAGGVVATDLSNAAAWTPVSLVPGARDGGGVFPHFFDRAKPGMFAVTREGRRFVNESASYHDFVCAMLRTCRGQADVRACIVCDHAALRRYGLGIAKPFPLPIGAHLRSGYLTRGDTIEGLAAGLGINATNLAATLAAYNRFAAVGRDPAFGKGGTAYNRYLGDASQRPNPCLRPLAPPFYAVTVVPGDIGTFAGLRTDEHARVVDADAAPIDGLYAVGNDMASLMGGRYPGGGITLGPGMTFGYIAANHIAGASNARSRRP